MRGKQSKTRPYIGISANTMDPTRNRRFYIGKALQYAEQEMLDWVWEFGGMPIMLPVMGTGMTETEMAEQLDGLVLSGGMDVSPTFYGEEPRRAEWAGHPHRDEHEFGLFREFASRDKPVLGICRGHQVINVALGGSLYQDIIEDGVVDKLHRDPEPYDLLRHDMHIVEGTRLFDLYARTDAVVNSVHHQAIRRLADGLTVMATSDDNLIEAFEHTGYRYLVGVQWHPEWVNGDREDEGLLSSEPLFRDFIENASASHLAP